VPTVFLFEPERTQFDLTWRMFGVNIRVHPMFWVISAMMGWNSLSLGFQFLFVWIACVFVSILIHELGHVGMGRLFGADGHIVLYSFGGLAVGSSSLASRWKRIAVYFAGPFAGFLFFGLLVLVYYNLDRERVSPLVRAALSDLFWINLFWGLVNLLPIWPLDGGQISRDLFDGIMPRSGTRVALGLSIVVAGLLALGSVAAHNGRPIIPYMPFLEDLYFAIFFGILAVNSFLALQVASEHRPWDRGPDY
jgi:Zn-dependent protease